MILVIDNYDSFVYNLVQYLGEMVPNITVVRNDRINLKGVEAIQPSKIVISPGPGRPEDAGITCELIRSFAPRTPLLGVCLGHQALGYAFGAKIVSAPKLMHGKTSLIHHRETGIYRGVENPFLATRYHSLIVDRETLPPCFVLEAWTEEGEVMGIRHREYPAFGVQFHPESILTGEGKKILKNFLEMEG